MKEEEKLAVVLLAALFHAAKIAGGRQVEVSTEASFEEAERFVQMAQDRKVWPDKVPG